VLRADITDVGLEKPAAAPSLRVLVVDDHPDFVSSLTGLLRLESFHARGVHSAQKILQDIRDFDPQVVILDIEMPGKTGWEAAKEIRAGLTDRRVVLIGMSGEHKSGSDRAQSQASGFDYYLMKPCDPNVLITLLRYVKIQSPFRPAFR
jgi:DNA-binding response OmpR family regulator